MSISANSHGIKSVTLNCARQYTICPEPISTGIARTESVTSRPGESAPIREMPRALARPGAACWVIKIMSPNGCTSNLSSPMQETLCC